MVDDSHAVGFVGSGGQGTPGFWRRGRVRARPLTGTLGRRWAGAFGRRLCAGPEEITIQALRQGRGPSRSPTRSPRAS